MRLQMNPIRDHQNTKPPLFSNIANRINYLQQKNTSVNKKLLACVNSFERRLLSERSHDSSSKDKSSPTFRINPGKKVNQKIDAGRFLSQNSNPLKGTKVINRNCNTELESKESIPNNQPYQKSKNVIGFQFSQSNSRKKQPQQDSILNENIKRGKRMLQKVQSKKAFKNQAQNEQQTRMPVKTDNFFKTMSKFTQQKKSPYSQMMSSLYNRKHNKKPDQQKLKLIEIKKKLLEEQQKSLMEYQKCILYKQKVAQKIKYESSNPGQVGPEGKAHTGQSQALIYENDEEV